MLPVSEYDGNHRKPNQRRPSCSRELIVLVIVLHPLLEAKHRNIEAQRSTRLDMEYVASIRPDGMLIELTF